MSPGRDPAPRAREAVRWLPGLAFLGLLAAGIAGAAMLFWEYVDVETLLQAEEAPSVERITDSGVPPAAPASPEGTFRVGVLETEASAPFFPDPGFYGGQVDRWRALLDSLGADITTVSTAGELEALDRSVPVVVPVAPCLSFELAMTLYRRARTGGSLVLEGPVGARDEACEWRGWSVVRSFTGARDVRQVEPRESLYLTVPAGLPISHGLVPGDRIEFGHDLQVAVEVRRMGGYWSDWALSPRPVAGTEQVVTGALTRVTEAGGRVTWFGFLGSEAATADDRRRVRRMQASAVAWAAGRPMASLAGWPDGSQAALLLTEDVEGAPENARLLADLLERRQLPGSFFVVSDFVEDEPELAATLAARGEVGTHSVDHRTLAGHTEGDQLARLRRSRTSTASWCDCEVDGLRPPKELFDRGTLKAWRQVGGGYLAAENQGRSASPELHEVPGGDRPMVLLPRVMKDDYNLLVNDGLSWPEAVPALVESARKVHRLGGLAMVSFRTQLLDLGAADALEASVDSLTAWEGWWPATAGQAAAWWRARHAAGLAVGRVGDDRLELRLAAPADTALRGATVSVLPPGDPEEWTPAADGQGLRFTRTPYEVRVVVDEVAAGDTATIVLRRTGGSAPTAAAAGGTAAGGDRTAGARSRPVGSGR